MSLWKASALAAVIINIITTWTLVHTFITLIQVIYLKVRMDLIFLCFLIVGLSLYIVLFRYRRGSLLHFITAYQMSLLVLVKLLTLIAEIIFRFLMIRLIVWILAINFVQIFYLHILKGLILNGSIAALHVRQMIYNFFKGT